MKNESIQPAIASAPARLVRGHYVWWALSGWLMLSVPLFIGLPLNSDTALYDVQARSVFNGGVAYRDIIEPNLPGALWIHLGIRSFAGWSSEVMRCVDLAVLLGILWLWTGFFERKTHLRPVFLLAGTVFYLTRNEWCHAQRDTWMLLPVGLAMTLRFQRAIGTRTWSAFGEGLCWGCAVWIKPHVVFPAAAVMLVDWQRRASRAGARDIMAVTLGGALAAVPGVAWLIATGAWEHFWHMMLEWNPEYVAAGRARMSLDRWMMMSHRFAPWHWIHAVAVPLALGAVIRSRKHGNMNSMRRRVLLSGCYLGWLVQSVAMQHALDYIHVPAMLLGLAVVCGHPWQIPLPIRRAVVSAFVVVALVSTPFFRGQRLQQWPVILSQGSTVAVRATLAHGNFPDWQHLGRVIEFLKERGVTDGDVTCLNVHSVHIYNETQTHPSTRYWSVSMLQDLFPQRAAHIADTVAASQQRYVVTETRESELLQTSLGRTSMDQLTAVFESGSYRVFEVAHGTHRVAHRSR